ncbi:hypothetical protein YTPLAS18_20700 [Nitrospira sp.]|nr:hypothetical protein YTPLAS18_20700 [Nitrospira sp.]
METQTPPPSSPSPTPDPDQTAGAILTHERSLSAKIGKGSEAGDILDQQVVMLGTQLVTQLNVLLKTSRLHGQANTALDKPVEAIQTLVQTLAHDEPVAIRVQNDFLFLGDHYLRLSSQQMLVFTGVIDSMNKLGIGGIVFSHELMTHDIREFAHMFVTTDPGENALQALRAKLDEHGVKGVRLEDPRAIDPTRNSKDQSDAGAGAAPVDPKVLAKTRARNGYGKAATAFGQLNQVVRDRGNVSFKSAKRAIQNIIDLMMQDGSTLLGLTNLRCHDQYTHNHSVNVALLSMALGNRAGYPKVDLADLGLAALFHDVGKCAISLDVLNKPGEFTKEEWDVMRSHPTEGVLTLIELRGLANVPARMAAASFEHHMNYDFSGYPKLAVPWKQTLSSRIVTIADCYDAMTSSRVYRREPMSPPKVLQFMFNKSGKAFDPILMKLFSTCVGIIPIGSLVMLDTEELAVVLSPAQEKEFVERPLVKIISDATGNLVEGPEVDLRELNEHGQFARSIIRLLDNTEYKFDTSRYFV